MSVTIQEYFQEKMGSGLAFNKADMRDCKTWPLLSSFFFKTNQIITKNGKSGHSGVLFFSRKSCK